MIRERPELENRAHPDAVTAIVAANGCDLLIIDTAPNADRASLLAAKAADFILVPCRPSIRPPSSNMPPFT